MRSYVRVVPGRSIKNQIDSVGRKVGNVGIPVVRPVGKYFYEDDQFYGQYYRTHQYRMKHYDDKW